jgi:hypothetical protein
MIKSDYRWGECYCLKLRPWIKIARGEQNQNLRHEGELTMKERSVRSVHYQLGIIIAVFLLVQVLAGLLISLGTLFSASEAKWLQVLGTIHTDWDPWGSVYRIILGLGTVAQVILGITIFFLSRGRHKKTARRA